MKANHGSRLGLNKVRRKAPPKRALTDKQVKERLIILRAFYFDDERYKQSMKTVVTYLTMLLSSGMAEERSLGHYTRLVYKPVNLPRNAQVKKDQVRIAVRTSHTRRYSAVEPSSYFGMSVGFEYPETNKGYDESAFNALEQEIRKCNSLQSELTVNCRKLQRWFTKSGQYMDRRIVVRPYPEDESFYKKKHFELVEVTLQNAKFIIVREMGIFTFIVSKEKALEWMK